MYIVVDGNTLKFCSTQILASLQTKGPANPSKSNFDVHYAQRLHLQMYLLMYLSTSYFTLITAHNKYILHVAHLSLHTADSPQLAELDLKIVVAK